MKCLENSFTERRKKSRAWACLAARIPLTRRAQCLAQNTSDLIKQMNCLKFKMLSFSPLSGNFPSFKFNRVESWRRKSWHNHSRLKPNILKSRFRPKSFGDLPLKGPVPFSKLCPGELCLEIIQNFKIEGFAPRLPSH